MQRYTYVTGGRESTLHFNHKWTIVSLAHD